VIEEWILTGDALAVTRSTVAVEYFDDQNSPARRAPKAGLEGRLERQLDFTKLDSL